MTGQCRFIGVPVYHLGQEGEGGKAVSLGAGAMWGQDPSVRMSQEGRWAGWLGVSGGQRATSS